MTSKERPEESELDDEWVENIRGVAPGKPTVEPARPRKVLMFSKCEGYQHFVTPHTAAAVRVLGEVSGAFDVAETETVEDMSADSLAGYDAIVLNNTCPTAPRRDIFQDYVDDEERAEVLKEGVINFIAGGGGLVPLHGGSLACMNCEKWEAMQGATFDHHPHHQWVTIIPTEPGHPLLKAFGGEPMTHFDEPYLFENKYTERNIRPLLVMKPEGMRWLEDRPTPVGLCPVAWLKRHGDGRIFYCSPSHYAQSFEDPCLLQFLLDGIQYALGDIKCEDTPPVS